MTMTTRRNKKKQEEEKAPKFYAKHFLHAFIVFEAAYLIALDAILDGNHEIKAPLSIIHDSIKWISVGDITNATCYQTDIKTVLLHSYFDRALSCSEGIQVFLNLNNLLRFASIHTQLFFFNEKFDDVAKAQRKFFVSFFGGMFLILILIMAFRHIFQWEEVKEKVGK